MTLSKGYAAKDAKSKLGPFDFKRRDLGDNDVLIDIEFCGICHSNIHTVKGDWGTAKCPLVVGHEMDTARRWNGCST